MGKITKSLIMILCVITIKNNIRAQDSIENIPPNLDMTNYIFKDTSDKEISLKKFKGKYIYLDIWASWCRPCINEFPSLDSLKEEFSKKNIVFVQVSCDAQKMRWTNALGWNNRDSYQYIIDKNSTFMQDLKVASIPRYLLIDKNGKLINSNMSRASEPQTKSMLLKLKGI